MAKLTLLFLILFIGYGEECESCEGIEKLEIDPRSEFYEILDKNIWNFVDAFMNNECKEACASLNYGVGEKLNEACELECKDFRSQPYFTMEDRPPLRDLQHEVLNSDSQNENPDTEVFEDESPQEGGCGCSGSTQNEDIHPEEPEASQGMFHGQEVSEDDIKKLNLDL